ncbi:MAG: hypothetical protein GQ550_09955 [Gammaproteobacteria bacterium]|nr:hypothetical protein [Gammaproteobacteria bacterium]
MKTSIWLFAYILLCLAVAATTSCVNTQNGSYTPKKTTSPQTLLDEKIEDYRHLYPEITFLILQGGDEFLADMMTLNRELGSQPSSMDYEHTPALREDLMYVSVERIRIMLESQAPSASLFEVDSNQSHQEYVCVLTINPRWVAADSINATMHLLDLPQEVIQNIPQDMQLPAADYLAFVIDHEVYHCLKSMYVGPQLMSYKELWGGYNHFLNELGADAYALGMHMKTRGEVSLFARNILRIRGMALYSADPDHLTCNALKQILNVPIENITKMSANEIFDLANSIKERQLTGHDAYVQYLASAVQAMKEIGMDEHISEDLHNKLKDVPADPEQVKNLVTNARRCLAELSGDELEP